MKKRITIFLAISLMALGVFPQDREHMIRLGDLMKPKGNVYAFALNQNLRTQDSPTFAGLTLSGSTASTIAYFNASKALTSLTNGMGFLYNNGVGALSFVAVDLSAYLTKDGLTPLTANWLGNPYQVALFPPILALTDGATQAISAAQCQSYVIHNAACTQNIEIDLPAAAVGMRVTVYVVAGFTIKIDPNGTDQIMVYTSTAGDFLVSDTSRGTIISLVCLQVNKWDPFGMQGSWTEE